MGLYFPGSGSKPVIWGRPVNLKNGSREIRECQVNEICEQIATALKELAGYIGPAAFGALIAVPPRYHHLAAAQYADVHLRPQQMVQLQQQHQQQMLEAQQMVVEEGEELQNRARSEHEIEVAVLHDNIAEA
jgi:hypothetical protein